MVSFSRITQPLSNTLTYIVTMGVTTYQVNLGPEGSDKIAAVRKARKIPSEKGSPGYMSDDQLVKTLLLERISQILPAGSKAAKQ